MADAPAHVNRVTLALEALVARQVARDQLHHDAIVRAAQAKATAEATPPRKDGSQ